MRRKMKMVLLSVLLCLVISLQSAETVHASVNYEACPFCGTRVVRSEDTKVLDMKYLNICEEHEDCDIYLIIYGRFETVTCQTVGCDGCTQRLLYSWKNEKAHVTQ